MEWHECICEKVAYLHKHMYLEISLNQLQILYCLSRDMKLVVHWLHSVMIAILFDMHAFSETVIKSTC